MCRCQMRQIMIFINIQRKYTYKLVKRILMKNVILISQSHWKTSLIAIF